MKYQTKYQIPRDTLVHIKSINGAYENLLSEIRQKVFDMVFKNNSKIVTIECSMFIFNEGTPNDSEEVSRYLKYSLVNSNIASIQEFENTFPPDMVEILFIVKTLI